MRRRDFIASLGSMATAWPLAVRAQNSAMPVIGFFHGNKPGGDSGAVDGVRAGLRDAGFIEGKNFVFEYRWAEKHFDRNPALASDLVSRKPAVIIVGGGSATALATKAATSTIPMVLAFGSDPVELGLASSLSHPGGNVTGVIFRGQHAGERVQASFRICATGKDDGLSAYWPGLFQRGHRRTDGQNCRKGAGLGERDRLEVPSRHYNLKDRSSIRSRT